MDKNQLQKQLERLFKETDLKIDHNKKERHIIYIEFADKYRKLWEDLE